MEHNGLIKLGYATMAAMEYVRIACSVFHKRTIEEKGTS